MMMMLRRLNFVVDTVTFATCQIKVATHVRMTDASMHMQASLTEHASSPTAIQLAHLLPDRKEAQNLPG
jgi:hypothetical protein